MTMNNQLTKQPKKSKGLINVLTNFINNDDYIQQSLNKYGEALKKQKIAYAFAFCIQNNLNPAKREVSLIPNKKGELIPCIDYQKQLDMLETKGYTKQIKYIPNEEQPVAIKCIILKEGKEIGDYVAYVKEWEGQVKKPLMSCRIRAITQAIKENVPEMRRMLNNFEIQEVLSNENARIEAQETITQLQEEGKNVSNADEKLIMESIVNGNYEG